MKCKKISINSDLSAVEKKNINNNIKIQNRCPGRFPFCKRVGSGDNGDTPPPSHIALSRNFK